MYTVFWLNKQNEFETCFIILMPIRIRIGIGSSMEIRIRIGIKTMSIPITDNKALAL
jgi:hypothetical protein